MNRDLEYNKREDVLYGYRFANQLKSHTVNSAYLTYRDLCIETGLMPISRADYQDYFKRYAEMVADRLLSGAEWEVPHHMGKIKVVACKRTISSRYVNWGEFKKTGIYSVYPSTGTNKYVYKFKWFKTNLMNNDVKKYTMLMHRGVKKRLKDAIINGSVYELDT